MNAPTNPDDHVPAELPEQQRAIGSESTRAEIDLEADPRDIGNRIEASDETEAEDVDGNRAEPVADNSAPRAPRARGRRRRGRGGEVSVTERARVTPRAVNGQCARARSRSSFAVGTCASVGRRRRRDQS